MAPRDVLRCRRDFVVVPPVVGRVAFAVEEEEDDDAGAKSLATKKVAGAFERLRLAVE